MIYETDGQCDYVDVKPTLDGSQDGFVESRCLPNACWLHLPTGLRYCHKHTSYYESKIEPEWEPL